MCLHSGGRGILIPVQKATDHVELHDAKSKNARLLQMCRKAIEGL